MWKCGITQTIKNILVYRMRAEIRRQSLTCSPYLAGNLQLGDANFHWYAPVHE